MYWLNGNRMRLVLIRRKLICLTSFVLVLLAATSVTNAQVDILAQYSSFEEDESIQRDSIDPFRFGRDGSLWAKWSPGGQGQGSKVEIVETESIDGARSLRVEPKGTMPGHLVVYYTFFRTDLNEKCTVSFWAKAEEPRPLAALFKSEDNSISWGYTDFQLTTEWAEYSFTAEALNAEVKLELLCAGVEVTFWLDFVSIYEGEYVTGINPSLPMEASKSYPVDGALLEQTWVTLVWRAGNLAASHDVYFGDNFDDVNDGTYESETFRGNQGLDALSFVAGFPGYAYPDGFVYDTTYYWRIDEVNETEPNSPWVGEVWSFMVPPKTAFDPDPADGAIFLQPDVELSWSAGFGAQLHTLYLGEDFNDVNTATEGIPVELTNYTASSMQLAKTYYWRIDESTGLETTKGKVWSFSIADYIIVDDFESYTNRWGQREAIYQTWIDGVGFYPNYLSNGTGAVVGNWPAPYAEQTIVHGGLQSMPLYYDNDGTVWDGSEDEVSGLAFYSEAQREWEEPQDWTRIEVETLVLWFHGDPDNSVEPMYVSLEDSAGNRKDIPHPDPAALTVNDWQQWRIPLADFTDIDLTAIKIMYIGAGDPTGNQPGGSGLVRIDDIELHLPSE